MPAVILHCAALYSRCVALRCVALRCVALRCVALRCVAVLALRLHRDQCAPRHLASPRAVRPSRSVIALSSSRSDRRWRLIVSGRFRSFPTVSGRCWRQAELRLALDDGSKTAAWMPPRLRSQVRNGLKRPEMVRNNGQTAAWMPPRLRSQARNGQKRPEIRPPCGCRRGSDRRSETVKKRLNRAPPIDAVWRRVSSASSSQTNHRRRGAARSCVHYITLHYVTSHYITCTQLRWGDATRSRVNKDGVLVVTSSTHRTQVM